MATIQNNNFIKAIWNGPQFIKDARAAMKKGVEAGSDMTLPDVLSGVERDTGALAATLRIFKTRETPSSIISTIRLGGKGGVTYALHSEARSKAMRRALMKNEDSVVKNFEGLLK